jgi:HD superfamily phosphodiesterase
MAKSTTTGTIAGVTVPDTQLTRDATEFIRDAEDDVLFHHSRRVFFFGALHGIRQTLRPDPELLYVASMFHDLGLTERYGTSSPVRFEVDGANAAREFLREHGLEEFAARRTWLAIALHTTPE